MLGWVKTILECREAIGLAYWGAIMYVGEFRLAAKRLGEFGYRPFLEKRPQFHYIRSYYSDEPMVHIGIYEVKLVLWNDVEMVWLR